MFHIHTLEGDNYDIALESLLHRKDVKRKESAGRPRKFIVDDHENINQDTAHEHRPFSPAIRAYMESVKTANEFQQIFHAYQIMNRPVKTISPKTGILDSLAIFRREKVSHFPVVSGDSRIIGILSDRDVYKHLTSEHCRTDNSELIEKIMAREVITASSVTDIRRIAQVMFTEHIGSMPIIDDNKKLTGIITRSDILHALINHPTLKLWA